MSAPRAELDKLTIEEADAWFDYLERTRGQPVVQYEEVEPWAWQRLEQRLAAIAERRKRLQGAGAVA